MNANIKGGPILMIFVFTMEFVAIQFNTTIKIRVVVSDFWVFKQQPTAPNIRDKISRNQIYFF